MSDSEIPVFLSYSHHDTWLAGDFAEWLASVGRGVFQDRKSIVAGDDWREARDEALSRADEVWVIWCRHAKRSKEVQHEYRKALLENTTVKTLRVDSCDLAGELEPKHALNAVDLIGPAHARRRRLRVGLWTWAVLTLLLLGLIVYGVIKARLGGYVLSNYLMQHWPWVAAAALGTITSGVQTFLLYRKTRRRLQPLEREAAARLIHEHVKALPRGRDPRELLG